ncbi:hypothetical protein HanPI659440_Chr09g0324391 [Helianthus annuus]|nr:hypothetical protein HanPI659440_Chr09g0324391 [Helianthus annuus]
MISQGRSATNYGCLFMDSNLQLQPSILTMILTFKCNKLCLPIHGFKSSIAIIKGMYALTFI